MAAAVVAPSSSIANWAAIRPWNLSLWAVCPPSALHCESSPVIVMSWPCIWPRSFTAISIALLAAVPYTAAPPVVGNIKARCIGSPAAISTNPIASSVGFSTSTTFSTSTSTTFSTSTSTSTSSFTTCVTTTSFSTSTTSGWQAVTRSASSSREIKILDLNLNIETSSFSPTLYTVVLIATKNLDMYYTLKLYQI